MKTRFTMQWHGREAALAEPATIEREMARYLEASRRGDVEETGVFVGEAVALIRDIRPAGAILRQIVAEAEELLARKAPSLLSAR
jgi:NAD(P)H-dependent flavin oxidoreductase YrpB (nitropropane dioxygenase family)